MAEANSRWTNPPAFGNGTGSGITDAMKRKPQDEGYLEELAALTGSSIDGWLYKLNENGDPIKDRKRTDLPDY